jgi:hypothetical protein
MILLRPKDTNQYWATEFGREYVRMLTASQKNRRINHPPNRLTATMSPSDVLKGVALAINLR